MLSRRAVFALTIAGIVLAPVAARAELWLMIYPPLTAGTTAVDLEAPMQTWTVWSAFPQEAACHEKKALLETVARAENEVSIADAGRRVVFSQGLPPPSLDLDAAERAARQWVRETGAQLRKDRGVFNQVMAAQCIAANDPRVTPPAPAK